MRAAGLGHGHMLHAQAEADVFAHREMGEQGVALEDLVHAAPVGRQAADVHAVQEDAARIGQFETGEQAQERGLPAARGAEQRDEFSGPHREADVVDGGEIAKALGHAADLDHGGIAGVHAATRAPRRCSST
jgi:hypothetical protein